MLPTRDQLRRCERRERVSTMISRLTIHINRRVNPVPTPNYTIPLNSDCNRSGATAITRIDLLKMSTVKTVLNPSFHRDHVFERRDAL